MSEQKESSVLFSLKELMNLEEDRIKTEEAEKAATAAAAEKARLEAERTAREAEESRIRAEQERRRLEEQRVREDAARLDAIRHAEIEKARVEAEQKARLEAMAAQQQHERSLEAIKQDEGKKKLRNIVIAVSAVLVIGAVGGGLAFYSNVQETQKREAAAQAERTRLEDEQKKLKASLEEQQKKTDSLMTQLANAKDEATRLALQKQLEEEKAKTESIKKSAGGGAGAGAGAGRGSGSPGGGSKPCSCPPGDPLCSCL